MSTLVSRSESAVSHLDSLIRTVLSLSGDKDEREGERLRRVIEDMVRFVEESAFDLGKAMNGNVFFLFFFFTPLPHSPT